MSITQVCRRPVGVVPVLLGCFLVLVISPLGAMQETKRVADPAPHNLADCFSSDCTIYLEIPQPRAVVKEVLEHPVVSSFLDSPLGRQTLRGPQVLQLKVAIGMVEGQSGMEWQELLSSLTGRGLAAGFSAEGGSFGLLARAEDEAVLRKTIGSALAFVEGQARQSGEEVPFRVEENPLGKLAIFQQLVIGRNHADWVVANNRTVALELLERLGGAGGSKDGSLASGSEFQAAVLGKREGTDLWAFANLEQIRGMGAAQELFSGMAENPAAELIVGGLLENLKDSDWAAGMLQIEATGVSLGLETDHDQSRISEARGYFFGPTGKGAAPEWVGSEGMLANISAWRDLAGWWLAKEDLFDEGVVAQLVQADSQISTLFSGLDFGGEVLGSLEPGLQILVSRQVWSENRNPGLKLPGFALTGRLRDPAQMGRRFKVAFQSVMGFVNLGIAEQGQPQFDVDTSTTASGCICSSRVFPEPDAPRDLVVYNFSPTLIVDGDRLILSSTAELAESLQKQMQAGGNDEPEAPMDSDAADAGAAVATNTRMELDLTALSEVLAENREGLVAQNMLQNGHDREKAEAEVDGLLSLSRLLKTFGARLDVGNDRLTVDFHLGFEAGR